jgi:L-malate glycosyltransferase
MKITFIVSQYNRISGGNRAIFEYANRLQLMGNTVNIYVLAKPARWYRIDHWKRIINKTVTEVVPETIDWLENKIPINVLSYNDENLIPDSDILLATAWQTADFVNRFSDSKGKKFYFVQHHESLWTREKNKAQKTYYMPFKKLVISTWLKEVLQDKYQQKAEVLITPVNEKSFYREDNDQCSASRVCLLHHDYDWKGYTDAMEAVKILRSRNYKIDPVVFGEKLSEPSSLYEDAGFKFEYHYRPTGETLRSLYASCGIYLCSSWYEGLGMPSMEAMACGSALVTTDTGGSWDYALDGETALVSPPKQPEKLADNLARVMDDEILRNKLAENGCQKINEFSWESNSLRLENLFKESLTDSK